MLCLGGLYERGEGVTQDPQLASQWVREAAEAGHADGMLRYGEMLAAGRGVLPDLALAAVWFRKSAMRDNVKAQAFLGEMYEDGQGVPQDFEEAAAWYGRAAMRKHPVAMSRLGRMFMDGRGVKKDLRQATLLLFNAALLGDTDAMDGLASLGGKSAAGRSSLFGLALDQADRAAMRAAMRKNGSPVVREDDAFFCDVYKADTMLPGASLMAACFEPDGKRRLAMLKINYPTDDKTDTEKVMTSMEERLGPPSAREGSITRIWNFNTVLAVGQYIPTAAETSLMYFVPSVYAPLMRSARAGMDAAEILPGPPEAAPGQPAPKP